MNDAGPGRTPPLRRPGRRRRPVRRGVRLLAGQRRPRRGDGRAQALPAREDLRRRPHPPVGPPARGHGPGRRAGRRRPPLPGPALARLRPHPRADLARTTRTSPATATSSPARTSTPWSPSGPPRPAPTSGSGTEALEPLVEAGLVRGARVRSRPRGRRCAGRRARSRSGPATRWWPTGPTPASAGRSAPAATGPTRSGMAIRGYWTSPRHDEPWIDSWLDIRDKAGNVLPGYGWIFPVGDGRINVGDRPALHLQPVEGRQHHPPAAELRRVRPGVVGHPARDGVRPGYRRPPADGPVGRPPRRPHLAGRSATPAGTINPFNGEGIAYAYESGRLAADAVHLALDQRRRPGPADLRGAAGGRRTPSTTRWPGPSCGSSAGPS